MIVHKMTATFGKLDGSVLELQEGLNIITAPNEGGKSTWCGFLRAMLYGISTRERDTKTTLAEKNRWAPWSGAPMAGEIELTWRGRDITLRRFSKNGAPFGGFEAVYTGTGEPVVELTGDACGQTLLGVGRETFQRSAFVGQSGIPIDADPELEKRIAALVSSGEEDVSYSETAKTLKGWLNRRKHNKSGLIPKLEAQLEQTEAQLIQIRQVVRQSAEADGVREELADRKGELEAESAVQKARQDWVRQEQYRAAVAELESAQRELAALEREAGPLPEKEALRQAQGELVYLNTLNASLKEAQGQREPARQAVDQRCTGHHQLAGPGGAVHDQRAAGGRGVRLQQFSAGHAPARQVGVGEVVAPARQVHAQVLPEVDELQRGADGVAFRQRLLTAHAVQVQQQPAHGVGGAAAVVQQLGLGGIALGVAGFLHVLHEGA